MTSTTTGDEQAPLALAELRPPAEVRYGDELAELAQAVAGRAAVCPAGWL